MPTIWWLANGRLVNGRSFTGEETASGAKVCDRGVGDQSRKLFDGRAGVGETFRIGNVPFSVIGVLAGLGAAGRSRTMSCHPAVDAKSACSAPCVARPRSIGLHLDQGIDATAASEMEREIEPLLRQRHAFAADPPGFSDRESADGP